LLIPAVPIIGEVEWVAELGGEVPSGIDDGSVPLVAPAREVRLERGYGTEVPDDGDDDRIPEEPVPK
jgi:hypothetical protein